MFFFLFKGIAGRQHVGQSSGFLRSEQPPFRGVRFVPCWHRLQHQVPAAVHASQPLLRAVLPVVCPAGSIPGLVWLRSVPIWSEFCYFCVSSSEDTRHRSWRRASGRGAVGQGLISCLLCIMCDALNLIIHVCDFGDFSCLFVIGVLCACGHRIELIYTSHILCLRHSPMGES